MPWANSTVQDNGINHIKNNAVKVLLVKAYTAGDSLATVTGNAVAEANVASGDFTLSTPSAGVRRLTFGGKVGSATGTVASGFDLVFVFVSATEVLWMTDETTNMAVTSGNPITFPSLPYNVGQPT
jgi:hypothetical protein